MIIFVGTMVQSQTPGYIGGIPTTPGISPQPGFLLKGVWLPIVTIFPTGHARPV